MNSHKLINKTASLYANLGWKSIFARIRIWDSPYVEIEKLVPKKGNILELGCGEGLFANFLALASPKRKIYGIDIDKTRVGQANRGLKNTKFIYGDVIRKDLPSADVILMVHLLHHLKSNKSQEIVIKKCKSKLKTNGQLIIVEVEPKFSYKFFLAWFTDHFLVPWFFEKNFYSKIYFRKGEEWKKVLNKIGFSCIINPTEKNKPFSHIIIVARNEKK